GRQIAQGDGTFSRRFCSLGPAHQGTAMKLPLLHRLTLFRHKWFIALSCGLGCVAALGLAFYWYGAAATQEDAARWTLDEFRSIRGPRDVWDFVTGDGVRRRQEARRRVIAALQLASLHTSEVRAVLQARSRAFDPGARTNPGEWSLEETELRAV